jgi:hypothetical protein
MVAYPFIYLIAVFSVWKYFSAEIISNIIQIFHKQQFFFVILNKITIFFMSGPT